MASIVDGVTVYTQLGLHLEGSDMYDILLCSVSPGKTLQYICLVEYMLQ